MVCVCLNKTGRSATECNTKLCHKCKINANTMAQWNEHVHVHHTKRENASAYFIQANCQSIPMKTSSMRTEKELSYMIPPPPLSLSIRFLFINGQELCNSIRWRQREFMWWFVCVSFWFRFSFGIPFDMESAHNILCMCESCVVVVNRTREEEKVNERSEEREKIVEIIVISFEIHLAKEK